MFGFVDVGRKGLGRGIYNAAALAYGGKIRFVQHKTLLPTYDVFDEGRHFEPASKHASHLYEGIRWGLTLCEDIWSSFDFGGRQFYKTDPVALIKKTGAQIILNLSASPFSIGKTDVRRQLIQQAARKNRIPIVYCNLVGGNDDLVFDGQSLAANAKGELTFEGARFAESMEILDVAAMKKITPSKMPQMEEVCATLVLGLKDYLRKCGFKTVVIGLSGGVDSAVVAALAARALGPKQVTGISMPSPYSSRSSVDDARELAKRLGIHFQIVPIEKIYHDYRELRGKGPKDTISLADENIQARIRGNLLMAFSNETGALVLSTGNKSELACGYCTLYGDLAGGVALISDLPKTQVYALARHCNKDKEWIPRNTLQKPPSAELKPDQTDQDVLPPYEVLDAILRAYIEEHHSAEDIVKMGFARRRVEDVLRRVNGNEYKRRQAPLGIKVTSKAFGSGRRFPVAWKY